MRVKRLLLCLLLLSGSFMQQVMGQNLAVSGTVKSKTSGEALVGATVTVEGSTNSTLTDPGGRFTITASKGAILQVTHTGMVPYMHVVSKTEEITISMEESSASTLSDVVVVGYGTQKVTKVSGSISNIKSAYIEKLRPVRTEEALQGMA